MKTNLIKTISLISIATIFLFSEVASAAEAQTTDSTKKESVKKTPSKKSKAFEVSQIDDILEGDDVTLCYKIADILNEPENKKFADIGFIYGDEFVIPQKYSDFSLPVWEDVKREDLTKYVKSETWLDSVKKYEETHADPKEKLIIQKTTIDLDNDGTKEVVLRFGGQYKFMFVWSIFVSDVTPTKLSKVYVSKGSVSEESGIGKSRNIFFYKNKSYVIQPSAFDSVSVTELVYGPSGVNFYHGCYVSLDPSLEDSMEKKWNKIRQEYKTSKNSTLTKPSSN